MLAARISVFMLLIALAGSAKAPQTPTSPPASTTAPADPTLAAMQEDARKMHAILDQMKQNLGFVGGTTTPVNHQFQLQIEMWQLQVDQMDRHIAELQNKK